jgi:multiple antibiotic resistance protein
MLDWPEYGKLPVALWALVHPLGAVPIFLSLTETRPAERRHIGLGAAAATGVILILSVFVGWVLL